MTEKILSIVIPVYNNPDIKRAIDSVLNYKNNLIELIVIDGGSSDETVDIVKRYGHKVDILISEKDKGISDAFNKAIKLISGDWVFFLAADDQLICEPIEIIEKYGSNTTDLICGNIVIYDEQKGYLIGKSERDLALLDYKCSLRHPATFFRRGVYDKYGTYDTSIVCAIDRELFLRFRNNGARFCIINEYITLFRMGGMSTKNPIRYAYKEDLKISDRYGINRFASRKFFLWRCIQFFGGKIKDIIGINRRTSYMNQEELNRILRQNDVNLRI